MVRGNGLTEHGSVHSVHCDKRRACSATPNGHNSIVPLYKGKTQSGYSHPVLDGLGAPGDGLPMLLRLGAYGSQVEHDRHFLGADCLGHLGGLRFVARCREHAQRLGVLLLGMLPRALVMVS